MPDHHKYILKVTAGPTYDPKTHHPVHVNTPDPVTIDTPLLHARIHVRIQHYRGLPPNSPTTSPYFSHPAHKHDLYSISFVFTPKRNFRGDEIVFGNDFDHPIRDRLPPMFDTIFKYVKWWIDPGLEGDFQGDGPYLYGPLLSSINVFRVGRKGEGLEDEEEAGRKSEAKEESERGEEGQFVVYEEGGVGDGEEVRRDQGIPPDKKGRMKHFLSAASLREFVFEEGRTYWCDFFNPYLDFNEFALKLPIMTVPIIRYWDGQPLRYVLKHGAHGEPLFVIVFTLLPADQAEPQSADTVADGPKASHEEKATEKGKEEFVFVDEGVD